MLLDVLDGHHRQVVALFGIAHKLVYGLGHLLDEVSRLLLMVGEDMHGHIIDTLHLELGFVGVHGLRQSVGIEEDCGAGKDLRLL